MPKGTKLLAFADPEHPRFFAEFAKWDKASGGPDSHMATVGWLVKDLPVEQRLWQIGLYLGVYNVPTAEALWHHFPRAEDLPPAAEVEAWLRSQWDGIATRRERRSVRRPEQLAQFLVSYADWCLVQPQGWWHEPDGYEDAWASALGIYSVGRYIAIKLLEAAHRYCYMAASIPDIRAKDGWSPREGLALIYPEHFDVLMDPNGDIATVEAIADGHFVMVNEDYGVDLTRFEHQVFLCDYKQSYVGMRQYPGRSLDSEIEYYLAVLPFWPEVPFRMFDARAALFPPECLGEITGRTGVRKELGRFLRDTRSTWSDLLYQYPSMEARA